MKTARHIVIALAAALLAGSCTTPRNFNYMQDLADGETIAAPVAAIRLQPGDEVNILVKSKDPLMSALFNKGLATTMNAGQASGTPYMTGYTLDAEGTIDFPVLGRLKIGGLTRTEAERTLQDQLRRDQLKDANVTIEYKNLSFTVMGEVARPGIYYISKDALTLLEALGQAGDIGVLGKRDSVMVVRQQGQQRKAYVVSMNSARQLMTSDVWYIQQNDVIYVKGNDVRARQSTSNGNETRSISFWMSVVSLLTTVAILIFK